MKTLRVIKTDGIIHVNPPCPPKLTLTQVVNSKRSQILWRPMLNLKVVKLKLETFILFSPLSCVSDVCVRGQSAGWGGGPTDGQRPRPRGQRTRELPLRGRRWNGCVWTEHRLRDQRGHHQTEEGEEQKMCQVSAKIQQAVYRLAMITTLLIH